MQYSEVNPLFEFDIYKSQIDKSWNIFISIFRWSSAIQLSKPEIKNYDDYLGGNYTDKENFEDEIEGWFDNPSNFIEEDEDEEEEWIKEFSESTVGEEFLDDDRDYHPLEGIYYSHYLEHFMEVRKFNEDPLFQVEHQKGTNPLFDLFQKEKVMPIAIERNIQNGIWEKVISIL